MRFCRAIVLVFAALYFLALAPFLIAVLEPFGIEGDPMWSVFLLMVGLPWIRFMDEAPEAIWLVAAAPLVNLAILKLLCDLLGRARA